MGIKSLNGAHFISRLCDLPFYFFCFFFIFFFRNIFIKKCMVMVVMGVGVVCLHQIDPFKKRFMCDKQNTICKSTAKHSKLLNAYCAILCWHGACACACVRVLIFPCQKFVYKINVFFVGAVCLTLHHQRIQSDFLRWQME